jgi:tetratricopeptide (TPR) repeat protein
MNKQAFEKYRVINMRIFILISSLIIISCGSAPPVYTSVQKAIILHNQEGNKAFNNNDYDEALTQFNEALKLALTVENFNSIAISQINIAMVYRKIGIRAKAYQSIESIISTKNETFGKTYIYSALLLKTMLLMDDRDYIKAGSAATTALSLCNEIGCLSAGTLYNILTRIAIFNKDGDSAQSNAALALDINIKNNDMSETANSYRLQGDVYMLKSDFIHALESYKQAMIIDKSLDTAEKIFSDLMGIGNGFYSQGKYTDALQLFKRAQTVGVNSNIAQEITDSSLMIEKCESSINK